MNTSVSALLEECAGFGEGESEIPEEDEFFAEDNTKGIMIIIVVYFDIKIFFCSNYTKINQRFSFDLFTAHMTKYTITIKQCMVAIRETKLLHSQQ